MQTWMQIGINITEAGQSVGEDSIRCIALKAIRRLTKTECLSVFIVGKQMSWKKKKTGPGCIRSATGL